MNKIQPIDLSPAIEEIEEEKKEGDRVMDQKTRHFKYFEMLDTLPSTASEANSNQEHMLEVNAAGAF